jgi:hypothetical protein
VHVSRALWSDSTLRGDVVNAASQIVEKGAPKQQECKDGNLQTQTTCLFAQLKTDQEGLRPFPIGWPDAEFAQGWAQSWSQAMSRIYAPPPPPSATPSKSTGRLLGDAAWILLMKLLGLAWTGIAVSLGAPFWFDVLAKFMNIRGSGPKPKGAEPNAQVAVAKAQEAAAKAQEAAAVAQAAAPKAQAAVPNAQASTP